jgi:hypothetical protein
MSRLAEIEEPCPEKIRKILNIFHSRVSAANAAGSTTQPSEHGGKTRKTKEFSSATSFFPHPEAVRIAEYAI